MQLCSQVVSVGHLLIKENYFILRAKENGYVIVIMRNKDITQNVTDKTQSQQEDVVSSKCPHVEV